MKKDGLSPASLEVTENASGRSKVKIGIISDTHNNIKLSEKAVEIFKNYDVELVIHAGDISSSEIINLFKGLKCKFVLGNTDCEIDKINEKSQSMGFGTVEHLCDFLLNGKRFLVLHGHDAKVVKDAIVSEDYDYIIKGHTHYYEDYISNKSRIINPGSLSDKKERSVAILHLDEDRVEKINMGS